MCLFVVCVCGARGGVAEEYYNITIITVYYNPEHIISNRVGFTSPPSTQCNVDSVQILANFQLRARPKKMPFTLPLNVAVLYLYFCLAMSIFTSSIKYSCKASCKSFQSYRLSNVVENLFAVYPNKLR